MNKLLVIMVFIVSATLLVAGCSKGDTSATNTGDAPKDTVSGTNVPSDTQDSTPEETSGTVTSGDVVVAESKTTVEKNDETLAAVIVDGTYVENEKYMTPDGYVTMEVSLTVEKDIVTGVSITKVSADSKSANYMAKVNVALPDLVIGKNINEIQNLPKQISGSSLTTAAFKKQAEQFIADNPA